MMQQNPDPRFARLHKPGILTSHYAGLTPIRPGIPFDQVLGLILSGRDILLCGSWGSAMSFYSWMKNKLTKRFPVDNYPASRKYREALHGWNARVWIRILGHRADLSRAPQNPWLKEFYPSQDDFMIRFANFLGMNGAFQWYKRGIQYPVIAHRVHPFYGTYFPTRDEHLVLFDQWLSRHSRQFRNAVDIGTGCGILSLIMHKHGIHQIHATDISPNAIYSVDMELQRHSVYQNHCITTREASLLGDHRPGAEDLVVCNPPWIPLQAEKQLDRATYYEEGFFGELFDTLASQCDSGTAIALIFSDFALVSGLASRHPVVGAVSQRSEQFDMLSIVRSGVRQPPAKDKSWLADIRKRESIEILQIRKR